MSLICSASMMIGMGHFLPRASMVSTGTIGGGDGETTARSAEKKGTEPSSAAGRSLRRVVGPRPNKRGRRPLMRTPSRL
jgi:hypothetical protein